MLAATLSGLLQGLPEDDQFLIRGTLTVMAGFSVLMPALKALVFRPIAMRWLPSARAAQGKRLGEKGKVRLASDLQKFTNTAFKLLTYTVFVAFGWFSVRTEHHWLWEPLEYHLPYPKGNKVPPSLIQMYALETGYYLFSTVAVFFEPKMKDRGQLFLHHIFTSFLLISSWFGRTTKFGLPIMLLHDLADPPMELAKLCLYTGYEKVANVFFLVFTLVFVFLRDWIYPRYIVYACYMLGQNHYYKYYIPTLVCLGGLSLLHFMWTFMIFQVVQRSIIYGKTEDIREEE